MYAYGGEALYLWAQYLYGTWDAFVGAEGGQYCQEYET